MSNENGVVKTEEDASVPKEEQKDDFEQPEETKEEDFEKEPIAEDNNPTTNEEKTEEEEKKDEDNKENNVKENKEEESKNEEEDEFKDNEAENNNKVNEEQSSTRNAKSPKSHTTHSVTTYLDPEAPLPSHLPQKNSPENKEKLANYSYNPNDTGVTERPSCFNDLASPEKPYKSNEKHKTIAELLNPNPPQKVSVKTIMKEQRKNIDKIYQTKLEFSGSKSPRAKGNSNNKKGVKKTKSKSPRRVNK